MSQTTTIEASGCSLRPFERNRYFFGKAMTVRDFTAEQSYSNQKRHLLNRLVHGAGIVRGLKVSADDNGVVSIAPGVALDCCGREIVVSQEHRIPDLRRLTGFPTDGEAKTVFLCLKYDECVRDPIAVTALPSSCADACDYNRIREGFQVILAAKVPKSEPLCEERKILYDHPAVLVERLAPTLAKPGEVVKVHLIVTAKQQITEDLEVTITESLDPGLTAIKGLSSTGKMKFTLTGINKDQDLNQSYLVKIGGEGKFKIKATDVAVGADHPKSLNEKSHSEIQVVSGSLADLLTRKFFDSETQSSLQCDGEHGVCLAQLPITIDSNTNNVTIDEEKIVQPESIVYNNALLYDLIACGEDRLGEVPELQVSDDGEVKVQAAYHLDFREGLSVTSQGLSQADIAIKKGQGLKFESDSLTADLGRGLRFETNKIEAHLGDGLHFSGNAISARIGNGLKFDGGVIQPDYDRGAVARKVCEANDPRLSDARAPLPHKAMHQDSGSDEIDVSNLSGVLAQAQKVTVQDDDVLRGTQSVLNFKGAGVTVTNDTSVTPQRVNIEIPGAQAGQVTTGRVLFPNMSQGELRTSREIPHRLNGDFVAFILALEGEKNGEGNFFGDLSLFASKTPAPSTPFSENDIPQIGAACQTSGARTFVIRLQRGRSGSTADVSYAVRWWAIPMTDDLGTETALPPRNPSPALTSLSPNPVAAAGAAFTLTIIGTSFLPQSVVRWNGQDRVTTFVSATQVTAQILASDIAAAGTASVTVFNPAPGGGLSNALTVSISNLPPLLQGITPNSATQSSPPLTITVIGRGFLAGAAVHWNGDPRTTTFVNSTQLTAQIQVGNTPGQAQVTVVNPGGGVSNPLVFTILGVPILQDRILDGIRTTAGISIPQLAGNLNITRSEAEAAVKALQDAGRIRLEGDKLFLIA